MHIDIVVTVLVHVDVLHVNVIATSDVTVDTCNCRRCRLAVARGICDTVEVTKVDQHARSA